MIFCWPCENQPTRVLHTGYFASPARAQALQGKTFVALTRPHMHHSLTRTRPVPSPPPASAPPPPPAPHSYPVVAAAGRTGVPVAARAGRQHHGKPIMDTGRCCPATVHLALLQAGASAHHACRCGAALRISSCQSAMGTVGGKYIWHIDISSPHLIASPQSP